MKKYILTIMYNDSTDTVEWLQEEVIVDESSQEITSSNIAQLTSEDILEIMFNKEYAKA